MASVVFLRAVNVGGHKVFRPSLLAKQLSHLGAISIGAVGTFVIAEKIPAAKLREEITRFMPFGVEMAICTGKELLDLHASDPFRDDPDLTITKPFVTVLLEKPKLTPKIPLLLPTGKKWETKVIELRGRFVMSLYRPGSFAMVDKHFGVAGTTRNWNTIVKVAEVLSGLSR